MFLNNLHFPNNWQLISGCYSIFWERKNLSIFYLWFAILGKILEVFFKNKLKRYRSFFKKFGVLIWSFIFISLNLNVFLSSLFKNWIPFWYMDYHNAKIQFFKFTEFLSLSLQIFYFSFYKRSNGLFGLHNDSDLSNRISGVYQVNVINPLKFT